MSEDTTSAGPLPGGSRRVPAWLNKTQAPVRRIVNAPQFHAFAVSLLPEAATIRHTVVHALRSALASDRPPQDDERQAALEQAMGLAVHEFIEVLCGVRYLDPTVSRLLRQIGFADAIAGRPADAQSVAMRTGTTALWRLLRRRMPDRELAVAHLGSLSDALIAYTAHLGEEVDAGYAHGRRQLRIQPQTVRRQFLELLLDESAQDRADLHTELVVHAIRVGWPLPERVVVIRARSVHTVPDLSSTPQVLTDADASPLLAVCGAEQSEIVVEALLQANPEATVSVTWPVAPEEVPDADRVARRALVLAERGILPDDQVVRCPDHPVTLWLHAEPSIRRYLVRDRLEPMLREGRSSRIILAETMLAWFGSYDSAPAIAARLGVHPQTVRNRRRRIDELFGEALHDPEHVAAIMMALKASLPLWESGDHSDIAAYRARRQNAPPSE